MKLPRLTLADPGTVSLVETWRGEVHDDNTTTWTRAARPGQTLRCVVEHQRANEDTIARLLDHHWVLWQIGEVA